MFLAGAWGWEFVLCVSRFCTIRMQECYLFSTASYPAYETNFNPHTTGQSPTAAKKLFCIFYASTNYQLWKGSICEITETLYAFYIQVPSPRLQVFVSLCIHFKDLIANGSFWFFSREKSTSFLLVSLFFILSLDDVLDRKQSWSLLLHTINTNFSF